MRKEAYATGSQSNISSSIDLDVSAVLIGERSIGDIFGWPLVDWTVVDPHKGRKFHFGRQRRRPSLHDQLKPFLDRCDLEAGHFADLGPSPVVNASLTTLVGYLCRHFGRHHLPASGLDNPAIQRTALQEQLHRGVVDHILKRIEEDAVLSQMATIIREIAAIAESELEIHFAELINVRIQEDYLAGGCSDRNHISGLRDQARLRMEQTRVLNEQELYGLSMPDLDLDDDRGLKIEMAKILLHRFPYVRNYELMLFAELAMLQQPMTPRFARERAFANVYGVIDKSEIERLDSAFRSLGEALDSEGQRHAVGSFKDQTIAFCGSGPLPLSALLLHLMTDARIILIDRDQRSLECSRRLISNLVRLEIADAEAFTFHQLDAGALSFHRPSMALRTTAATSIVCDAVMIASLVDEEAKMVIAQQFSDDPGAPRFLIMRSATDLGARLAYDPIPTETFSRGALIYCGQALPANHVATHLDRIEAIRQCVSCTKSRDVLAIAHPDVVNTTEIFARFDALQDVKNVDVTAFTGIDDHIQQLETASRSISKFA